MFGNHLRSFFPAIMQLVVYVACSVALVGCNGSSTPQGEVGPTAPLNSISMNLPHPDRAEKVRTEGVVGALDLFNERVEIAGFWYWTDVDTEFESETCTGACTLADVKPGDYVKVVYKSTPNALAPRYATSIEVEVVDEPESDDGEIEGIVGGITVATTEILIGENWFWADGNTEVEIEDCEKSSFGDIQIGDQAKIEYRTPATSMGYYAEKIEIRPASPCAAD